MAARNGSKWLGSLRSSFRQTFTRLNGSGRSLLGIAILLIVLLVAVVVGWQKWGGLIGRGPQYTLTADSFEVTPQPAWIRSDVKAEVIRDGQLENLSALDPDLTKQVVQAFELSAWVSKVLWAGKRPGTSGPRIIVELKYREPIAMVWGQDPQFEGDSYYPVDTEGVLLPTDEFSPSQTAKYLRIHVGNVRPVGAVGTAYGDLGVAGGVAVATLIGDAWEALGLEWIVARPALTAEAESGSELFYFLLPSGSDPKRIPPRAVDQFNSGGATSSLQVLWGHAPGQELANEAKAAQKVNRLRQLVAQHGPLSQMPPTTIVDLRPLDAISLYDRGTIQPASAR